MTDIEIWKTVISDCEPYEGYKVSNLGRILNLNYKNTGKAKLMNPSTNIYGYLQVNLRKNGESKTCKVHRLVAETFLPNPENKPEVNHIDEDKTNNRVDNLEWKNHRDNCNHGTRNERIGKANKIVQTNNGKKSKRVLQLSLTGELIREWPSTREIERQLGFDHGAVAKCCNGKQKTAYSFLWMYK